MTAVAMVGSGLFHLLLLAGAAAVTGGLAGYAWRHREQPGAVPLSAAMVGVTFWGVTEMFALSQTWGPHLFWERVQWLAIAVVPVLFFLFIVDFTGYDSVLSRRLLPLYFVVPAVTVALVWTNPAHGLMWTDPFHIAAGGVVTLDQTFGPWFWVYFVYAYSLLIVGFLLLLRLVAVSEYLYFDQSVLIVVGLLAPLAGNAARVFGLTPLPGLDLTPYGFAVTGVAFGNALFRYRLFDLLPATRQLGRQAALAALDDGVVIVDTDREVLYMNAAAGEILDRDPTGALGEPADRLVGDEELDLAATDRLAELSVDGRTYEVETAPVADRRGREVGHTVLLYDVTERKRRERELRAQRDRFQRLERINTVIREVNQALVGATTVDELERAVVESLATPGLYDTVWLNTTASDGPPVRMVADDDSARTVEEGAEFGELPPPLVADDPDVAGTDLPADPAEADGGDWATVPVVYGRTVYGVLALHSDREAGFGERELSVLDELGETVGHALNAVEHTRLLVADTHVELDFRSTDGDALLVALAGETGVEWTLDGLVPADDGDLIAYLSTDEGVDAAAAVSHPGVVDTRRLATDGGTTLEVTAAEGMLAHPLVEFGANVRTATAADGSCRLVAEISPEANVRAVVERLQEEFPETELLAKREVEPTGEAALPDEADLTDRQREALEAAYRAGYFEWPRDSTAEEVAASLDIASPTLHGHLRKAENRLVETFFNN
ncbi:histidine kinase N-terminal 7TM domain-containing protein [Salinirussus salinus]|uniref:histidine kinase N-terminal 7TM domain-containing protein n=1 Tax=Salinirussus salinus TaxID=1198300 RepID=UPI00135C27F2|nr:histidine kinase N-terminal 7TM domain-containing protein [Salinirussus salinus]